MSINVGTGLEIGCLPHFNQSEHKNNASQGEGYMPIFPGMMHRYDARGLTDGFVAFIEYTCEETDIGTLALFSNRCGIRNLPAGD